MRIGSLLVITAEFGYHDSSEQCWVSTIWVKQKKRTFLITEELPRKRWWFVYMTDKGLLYLDELHVPHMITLGSLYVQRETT